MSERGTEEEWPLKIGNPLTVGGHLVSTPGKCCKVRGYSLNQCGERSIGAHSRLSRKGIMFGNEGLMQDEEQKLQAFSVWPCIRSFCSQRRFCRDEMSSGRRDRHTASQQRQLRFQRQSNAVLGKCDLRYNMSYKECNRLIMRGP